MQVKYGWYRGISICQLMDFHIIQINPLIAQWNADKDVRPHVITYVATISELFQGIKDNMKSYTAGPVKKMFERIQFMKGLCLPDLISLSMSKTYSKDFGDTYLL